jgi:hypothetical protein
MQEERIRNCKNSRSNAFEIFKHNAGRKHSRFVTVSRNNIFEICSACRKSAFGVCSNSRSNAFVIYQLRRNNIPEICKDSGNNEFEICKTCRKVTHEIVENSRNNAFEICKSEYRRNLPYSLYALSLNNRSGALMVLPRAC